jgi:Cysteinyl-tRNA synthetase
MEVYNTMTRRKETFQPREPGRVGLYVCGPTTYNYIHLGNARPLVFFDTVRRYFAYKGYDVLYIQNFTDVDDKIINRAAQEGKDPLELSRIYINEYFKDGDALNVRRADEPPQSYRTYAWDYQDGGGPGGKRLSLCNGRRCLL